MNWFLNKDSNSFAGTYTIRAPLLYTMSSSFKDKFILTTGVGHRFRPVSVEPFMPFMFNGIEGFKLDYTFGDFYLSLDINDN